MSPEIINGQQFDLPTDVFSLGIIFVEIMSRRLVDSRTYTVSSHWDWRRFSADLTQRQAPSFTPDPDEIRRRTSAGCPPLLVDLAEVCCLANPSERPKMSEVLDRLREIELEVLSRLDDRDGGEHVGSVRLVSHAGKRAMPIFDVDQKLREADADMDGEEDVRKMEQEALVTLAGLDIGGGGAVSVGENGQTWRTARWQERGSALSEYTDANEVLGQCLEAICCTVLTRSRWTPKAATFDRDILIPRHRRNNLILIHIGSGFQSSPVSVRLQYRDSTRPRHSRIDNDSQRCPYRDGRWFDASGLSDWVDPISGKLGDRQAGKCGHLRFRRTG